MAAITPIRQDAPQRHEREDDVKWLALLIRQGLLLIVAGIERRYGLISQRHVID